MKRNMLFRPRSLKGLEQRTIRMYIAIGVLESWQAQVLWSVQCFVHQKDKLTKIET